MRDTGYLKTNEWPRAGEKMTSSENIPETSFDDSDRSPDGIVIRASGLGFSYGVSGEVLKDIDLEIRKGEYVVLTGKNGSGKSTFALCLNALLKPSSGKLEVFGLDTSVSKNLSRIRKSVGIVFQNPYMQFVGDTVEEDVAFGPENLALPRDEIIRRVNDAIGFVGLDVLRTHDPATLSGGEAQCAAIAGVLAMNPGCIVFDEVTSMLDAVSAGRIRCIIDRLRKDGKTIILISHDPAEILRADRVIVFDSGTISFSGTPAGYIENKAGALPEMTKLLIMFREYGCPVDICSPGNAEDVFRMIRPYLVPAPDGRKTMPGDETSRD